MLSARGKKEYAKEAQAVAATCADGLPAAIVSANGAAEEALVAMVTPWGGETRARPEARMEIMFS